MGINLGQTSTSNPIQAQPTTGITNPGGLLNLDMGRTAPVATPAPNLMSLNLEKVQTSTGLSLDLSKAPQGLSLDMEKDIAGKPLVNVRVGLGWDPVPGQTIDLDTFCIMLEDNHVVTGSNVIYFRNTDNQGIKHSGDNRTGDGDGDDEFIDITLPQIPAQVNRILVFANIFEADKNFKTFGSLQHAYVRMLNKDEQVLVAGRTESKELCRYVLPSVGATFNAFNFCELERVNGSWKLNVKGEAMNGSIVEIANRYV